MPILEPFVTLGYLAAATSRVTLGTEVLVLPQREPTLVAKQVSTLDTLSGGRVRLGVGVGWQESEYEALGESFHDRGARMDEAIRRHAEAAGRDPKSIGLQSMVAPPPRDAAGKRFYAEHERVVARALELQQMGFQWISINATAIFQAGARSVDAMSEALGELHGKLRKAVG